MNKLLPYKRYIILGVSFLGLYFLRKWINGPRTYLTRNLQGSIIIVTGASDGIGKETALALLKDGATVIFACRNEEKAKKVIESIHDKALKDRAIFMRLDLASFASVSSFVQEFSSRFTKLDILVNNAGGMITEYKMTQDKIETNLQINALSTFLLTQGLLDILHRSNGRVINVSSGLYTNWTMGADYYDSNSSQVENYDFNKSKFTGSLQYGFSKMGIMYFTQQLHDFCLKNKLNIQVCALHPGVILTNGFLQVTGFFIAPFIWFFTKSKEMGIQTTLHCCYLKNMEFKSGSYYADCKEVPMNSLALDMRCREGFIKLSRTLIQYYGGGKYDLII